MQVGEQASNLMSLAATKAEYSTKYLAFCELLENRSKKPKQLWENFYYDKELANRAIDFIQTYLIHTEGQAAGKPFILEWWQKRIIMRFFGWHRWRDSMRRYRVLFLFIGKKNGKSSLAAAIANYAAFADREPAPNIGLVASDGAQAADLFKLIRNQIESNKELLRRVELFKKSIYLPRSLGSIRVLSRKPQGKHGPNWQAVIADECHAIEDPETVDALTAGIIARTQPIVCYLSTAGFDKTHWFYRLYEYAKRVKEGTIVKEDWLVEIYEADPEKWKEPSEWRKANPNMGVTFSEENFRSEFDKACQMPSYENTFKRLHLNCWTEQETRWISLDKWEACNQELDLEALKDKPCYGGLDLSSVEDLSALVLAFPLEDNMIAAICRFWIPEETALRRQRKGIPYFDWAQQGWITKTPGDVIDFDFIRKDINALMEQYEIRELAVDRMFNSAQISTQLTGDGFKVIPFGQGFTSMTAPSKFLETIVLKEQLIHGSNPVLRWMASNVVIELDAAGNIKPSKRKAREKIDGIVSLIMALGRLMVQNDHGGSVYQERGLFLL